MKILLDECIPRRLKFELKNHDAKTVQEMGWTGKKNGDLLALADKGFEVFITLDKNLEAQLNVSKFNLKIVVFSIGSSRLADIKAYLPQLHRALDSSNPDKLIHIKR